ncbi:hypothetical protein A359_02100 [secondary endosymbiont of Ctenarytaina eucalypti]|uniref:Uncharacterized protein n=1 Tax=secondary endosymbiont of Ctenarytaina eucalypti TaxID=1199245 RepID=J3VRL6_9ENTR|nr:hypothetical protein A359_02100 [secondary endosymbiont of Ctenarytaina eucalypti]
MYTAIYKKSLLKNFLHIVEIHRFSEPKIKRTVKFFSNENCLFKEEGVVFDKVS